MKSQPTDRWEWPPALTERECHLGEEHGIPPEDVCNLLRVLGYSRCWPEWLDRETRCELAKRSHQLAGALDAMETLFERPTVEMARLSTDRSRASCQLFESARQLADLAGRVAEEHVPPASGERKRPSEVAMARDARAVWIRHNPDSTCRAYFYGPAIPANAPPSAKPNDPGNAYTRWMVDALGAAGVPNRPGENRVRTVLVDLRLAERGGR